ncbi:hypothetical protein Tsubulata_032257 [Turnera subulata]|uniref:Glycosyltransferase n=1 Tax=Turnera subulata TaxID=218843 RepID=A0A9Q0FCG3_9ROSI|nr:hypothetical protein Tsubulata_032257 [Turnera subulata]
MMMKVVMMLPQSPIPRALLLFAAAISAYCFLLSGLLSPSPSSSLFLSNEQHSNNNNNGGISLERVLKRAAMGGGGGGGGGKNTVILTTLNAAWAEPNSVIDLFLESFRSGEHTRGLLNHLVIVGLDQKAYSRCLRLHPHCFPLVTPGLDFQEEAYFMTRQYLNMMWTRIRFLLSVLEMGFNFVFTDADIMWFRDPFPRFYPEADFQIACDHFVGSPENMHNKPNGGFTYVKSNNRSIQFFRYWYSSRTTYPGYHDQDVLNFIKRDPFLRDIGLSIRFLDTAYFGGLCEPSKDLNLVCTMHANCCYGLSSKLHDLTLLLQDWKAFLALPPSLKRYRIVSWRAPHNCSLGSLRHYDDSVEQHKLIQHELQE